MIDWHRVDELRDEVGAEDFEEVVDLFLEEVDEIIERLADSPDPARYEDDLHFLKGSALNLGFRAFGVLCSDGEQQSASGNSDSVDIAAVVTCYRESKEQFIASLGTTRAA